MPAVDVLIVGLGPTGATLAGLLGQQGVRVAVFDKLPGLYPLPRAIGLDHEAMRIMQQLGLADRMLAHIAHYRPSEYLGADGQLIKRLDTLPEPHQLGWLPNYVFDQPAFEKELRSRLAEMPNIQVFLEADVLDTGQTPEHAWASVRLAGHEEPVRFEGRYLIACDGGASPIRKRLGISLEDLDFDEPWLVVDALVNEEVLARLPQTQVQYCEPERPSTFVVGPGRHRRWEIMLLEGDSLSPDFPEEELWPLLRRWIQPGEATLWRAAAYRFHGLVANAWRDQRILLAGDAAHMTPPFMAQGMVGGLRDAHNLAWKLTRVLQGKANEALLDTYMQERRPHIRQTILAAMGLGRIICERDPDAARERDRRLRAAHGGVVKTEFRQNMIPGLLHGIVATGTPMAGALFPQPRISAGEFSGLLDDFTGARVRVVLNGNLSGALLEAYQQTLAAVDGVLVSLASDVTETHALLAPWLTDAAGASGVVVVRPDHYVYGCATSHAQGLLLLQQLQREICQTAK